MNEREEGYKLLLVDDEPLIRKGIRQLIDLDALSIGEVFEASDGAEALSFVMSHSPDIVLADINMPNMDGLALAKAVKAMDRKTRVAIITGYDYFEYALSALKSGVDDFLLKPVSGKDIRELLHKLTTSIREERARELALESLENIRRLPGAEGPDAPEEASAAYYHAIMKTIDENVFDPAFSLSALAKKVNLSPGYLSALFKRLFGISFQDYLINARLERAKILLLTTGWKVYEIAEKVGFEDPNYFSTSFKKHYGVSPNKFRDA